MLTMKSIVLPLALAACAAGTAQKTVPTTPTPVVELGELTLFEGDDAMLKIHTDGSTELGYRSGRMTVEPGKPASSDSLPVHLRPGPMLRADGTIEHGGKALGRITAEGAIINLVNHATLPLTVSADKLTLVGPGKTIAFELAANGTISITGADSFAAKPLRVAGADTPGKRKAMLALIAVQLAADAGKTRVEVGESTATP